MHSNTLQKGAKNVPKHGTIGTTNREHQAAIVQQSTTPDDLCKRIVIFTKFGESADAAHSRHGNDTHLRGIEMIANQTSERIPSISPLNDTPWQR